MLQMVSPAALPSFGGQEGLQRHNRGAEMVAGYSLSFCSCSYQAILLPFCIESIEGFAFNGFKVFGK